MLACNLGSALTPQNPTEPPLPTANPTSPSDLLPEADQPTPTEEAVSGSETSSALDICALVTRADVEKFFGEPAGDPKPVNSGCTFTNAKDGLYAFSLGAAQDKEASAVMQGQALLLGMAGVKLDEAAMDRLKSLADALDYKGYFTELATQSKSSPNISAKLFAGGGNDLTYWAWITVPPRATGAFVAVRGTTLVSLYVVVPESQTADSILTTANNLAGEIFKKLPEKFTIEAGSSPQPPSTSDSPTATLTGKIALPAPTLISPENGAQINDYPRNITLTWSAVPGARKYLVEIMACSSTNPENCFSHPMLEKNTRESLKNSYSFEFIGMQPGKWRVFPMTADNQMGTPSEWWTFTCTK
jgi:methionine-rich copper-binding protein CopC